MFCFVCFFTESNVLAGTLVAHTDAVWGLAFSGIKNQLLSCSADGTVRLWNPQEKLPCICTYNGDKGKSNLPLQEQWLLLFVFFVVVVLFLLALSLYVSHICACDCRCS